MKKQSLFIIVIILSGLLSVASTKQTVLAAGHLGWGVDLKDSLGKPLTGHNNYIIHFTEKPPGDHWKVLNHFPSNVTGHWCWSAKFGFCELWSYGVKKHTDGSFDIYVQHQTPGKDEESNWLPSPKGSFTLTLAGFPQSSRDPTWHAPPVQRIG